MLRPWLRIILQGVAQRLRFQKNHALGEVYAPLRWAAPALSTPYPPPRSGGLALLSGSALPRCKLLSARSEEFAPWLRSAHLLRRGTSPQTLSSHPSTALSGRQGGGRRGAASITRPPTPQTGCAKYGQLRRYSIPPSPPIFPSYGRAIWQRRGKPSFFLLRKPSRQEKASYVVFSCHSVCILAKKKSSISGVILCSALGYASFYKAFRYRSTAFHNTPPENFRHLFSIAPSFCEGRWKKMFPFHAAAVNST